MQWSPRSRTSNNNRIFLLIWLEKKEAEPLAGPRGNGSRPVLSPLPGRFLASYLSSRHPHPPNVPTGRRTFSSFRLPAPYPGLAGSALISSPFVFPQLDSERFFPRNFLLPAGPRLLPAHATRTLTAVPEGPFHSCNKFPLHLASCLLRPDMRAIFLLPDMVWSLLHFCSRSRREHSGMLRSESWLRPCHVRNGCPDAHCAFLHWPRTCDHCLTWILFLYCRS